MNWDENVNDSSQLLGKRGDAAFLRVIANSNRLKILAALMDGPRHVGALEAALGLSQAYVSQQLARLRSEGIVTGERCGRSVKYQIVDERVRPMLELLHRYRTAP